MSNPTPYGSCISDLTMDEICPISLDDFKEYENFYGTIIMIADGLTSDVKPTVYLTDALVEHVDSCKSSGRCPFVPVTNRYFDSSELRRIEKYRLYNELYPKLKVGDIDIHQLITDWRTNLNDSLKHPILFNSNLNYLFELCVKFEDLITYYNFDVLEKKKTRTETYTYIDSPDNGTMNWLIRYGSVEGTELNRTFAITFSRSHSKYTDENTQNHLFVHKQGYGIIRASAVSKSKYTEIEFIETEYYVNIGELLSSYLKCGDINKL
jgi:hypothetical protein